VKKNFEDNGLTLAVGSAAFSSSRCTSCAHASITARRATHIHIFPPKHTASFTTPSKTPAQPITCSPSSPPRRAAKCSGGSSRACVPFLLMVRPVMVQLTLEPALTWGWRGEGRDSEKGKMVMERLCWFGW
jgi:hypothetical protein